jgi:hypothetical protein
LRRHHSGLGYSRHEDYSGIVSTFPEFPKELTDFALKIYSDIPGNDFSFLPYQYWLAIMKHKAKRKALLMARQLFKTSYFGLKHAHQAVIKKRSTTCYVAPDEDKLSTYADQKYRSEILDASPLLRSCIRGHTAGLPGRRSKIQWMNGSFNWNVTDEGGYKKVEGKSGDYVTYDEVQEHDLGALPKAKEAQSKKAGIEEFGGVGGELGSEWEEIWRQTTQSEWKYDIEGDYVDHNGRVWPDQAWRKELDFGKHEDADGNIRHGLKYGNYMNEVCRGYWEETEDENFMFPGFHLSQLSACHVPLTMRSAVDDYKQDPSTSIEWKENNYPRLMAIAHVHGDWYKAPRKPITRADAYATMKPYAYLHFFNPSDVLDLKQTFPERVKVMMGIDWGSGNTGSSETVITIMLKWIGVNQHGQLSADRDRYFVIFQERIPYTMSETMEEAFYALELFHKFYCDYGAADMGYGAKQCKAIIDGGVDPRDREFKAGLTLGRFIGVWSRSRPEQEEQFKNKEVDEEGNIERNYLLLDKTQMLELFIDTVKWKVPHPAYLFESAETQRNYARSKLAIPYAEDYKVEQLVTDMTKISRKDLEVDILSTKEIGLQKPQKQYNHPPDSVSSMNHCLVSDRHYGRFGSFGGTSFTARKGPGGKSRGTVGASSFRGTRR